MSASQVIMVDPALYQTVNSIQKRDTADTLQEYCSRMRWKNKMEEESILDIGCGDGGVTVDILLPYIPNCRKLSGCDIGLEMIEHSKQHHKQKNIDFRILDIAGEVPSDMVEEYDHVFSFYALHWVLRQKEALINIHKMLNTEGDCLLMFLGHMPVYNVYRIPATTEKWAKYMYDVEKFISPYQDSEKPELELAQLMKEVGFKAVDVQCKKKEYVYKTNSLKSMIRVGSPFYPRLPSDMREEFLVDHIQKLRNLGFVEKSENEECCRLVYTLMVAYGVK